MTQYRLLRSPPLRFRLCAAADGCSKPATATPHPWNHPDRTQTGQYHPRFVSVPHHRAEMFDRRWIATSRADYLVGASSYPRHRFSSGFYPFFALSVLPQSKSFWLQANVRAWTGRNGDQREPFQ